MAAPLSGRVFRSFPSRLKILSRCFSSQEHSSQENHDGSAQTHFGFETVAEEEKEKKVYEVFENVATTYDLMNDAMSAGIHRVWKDMFVNRFAPSPGTKLLDVAGGTGDIALRFLKYVGTPTHRPHNLDIVIPRDITAQVYMDPAETSSSSSSSDEEGQAFSHNTNQDENGSHVTVCDINQAMLDVGKKKAETLGYSKGISWLQGNAENLPLPDGQFDAFTIAFGIRNCTHVEQVLNEAYRLLKPGGRFLCLEFSEVKNPLLRQVYDSYSFQVIPVMGQLIADDWRSYQYLVESIRRFPNQEEFADMIKAAGFRIVQYENLTFGVAAIHSGFKI